FQRATVTRVIAENADVRTFVLAPQEAPFAYRAGQFCTFRVRVNGRDLLRSYSMSSAPETDAELMTTVKRVPGGAVSSWMVEHLAPGDEVELTRPRGVFCLREADAPLLGFSGGSGITPILSLAKSALATTGSYVCGPEPFMALVESALSGPGRVFSERFGGAPLPPDATARTGQPEGTVTIVLGGKRVSVPRRPDETLLESARRAGLAPPFSCEAGNCATCIAKLTAGEVKMRVNDVLTGEEIADGYVLTCQSVPQTPSVTVRYE
ncbi:MAG: hypothetical protein V7603_5488, partial [Micromonosporaceae bacterium]